MPASGGSSLDGDGAVQSASNSVPFSGISDNQICQSVFKVEGALVGPIVRYVLTEGVDKCNVLKFCATRPGGRPVTCVFKSKDAGLVFERDVEPFLRTVRREASFTEYHFAIPARKTAVDRCSCAFTRVLTPTLAENVQPLGAQPLGANDAAPAKGAEALAGVLAGVLTGAGVREGEGGGRGGEKPQRARTNESEHVLAPMCVRAYVQAHPLVTTHDIVGITRSGIQLVNGFDARGRLGCKPSPFAFVAGQMSRREYSFLPQYAPAVSGHGALHTASAHASLHASASGGVGNSGNSGNSGNGTGGGSGNVNGSFYSLDAYATGDGAFSSAVYSSVAASGASASGASASGASASGAGGMYGWLGSDERASDYPVANPVIMASVWQELMLDNCYNVARCWQLKTACDMPAEWCCGICSGRDTADLSDGQPASEGMHTATLPCTHAFHTGCIARVPASSGGIFACPLCRRSFPLHEL